jgi:hypothetical protein
MVVLSCGRVVVFRIVVAAAEVVVSWRMKLRWSAALGVAQIGH